MRRALRAAVSAATLTAVGVLSRDATAEPACTAPKTTCAGHSGYYAPTEDIDRLTAVADPILRDVRTCLDGVGAKHVASVLVIRWDSDGNPVDVKIDVPGYEGLPCVQKAQAKIATLQNPRETAIRCEFGCAPPPPPPKPSAPPIVVAPPAPVPTQTQAAPAAPPPPVAPKPEQPQYEKVWYGYQTLIADAASFSLLVGGIAARSGGVTTAGYLGFLLATPIVHMAHGNIGPGFGSIGLRLLVPLIGLGVGAIAGVIIGSSQGSGAFDRFGNGANGAVTGAVIGGLIAAGGCVAIDAGGLAYTKERVDDRAVSLTRRRPAPWFTLAPSVDVRRDRASFGVAGQF
ncbi:MAG: hypothetical protein KF764_26130 [Labilithrix sp.]|nr:hypothetical protein [Labilithrix sp.]MBX3221237.1 hypothetical protein [Labilithrix sp.]